MPSIKVDIVSAYESLYSVEATSVIAPAKMGDINILPNHAPLISNLKPGEVRIDTVEGEHHHVFVSGGIIEVQPNIVTILSDTAVRAHDIDEAKVLEAKMKAEDAVASAKGSEEIAATAVELANAVAQLRVLQNIKKNIKR